MSADLPHDATRPLAPSLDLVKPKLRGWLHAGTFPAALAAGAVLVALSPTTATRIAAVVFAVTAAALFGTSALYHRGTWTPSQAAVLRRLDHSNIFLIIAGTYTPLAVTTLPGDRARFLLTLVWAGALAGVAFACSGSAPRAGSTPPSTWPSAGSRWVPAGLRRRRRDGRRRPRRRRRSGLLPRGPRLRHKRPNPSPRWFGFHEVFPRLHRARVRGARGRHPGRHRPPALTPHPRAPTCRASSAGSVVGAWHTSRGTRRPRPAVDEPAVGQELGRRRPGVPRVTTRPGAVPASAVRCSAAVPASPAAPTTATSRGPSTNASATASPTREARGRCGHRSGHRQRPLRRLPEPRVARQRGEGEQRPGGRGRARRRRPVGGVRRRPGARARRGQGGVDVRDVDEAVRRREALADLPSELGRHRGPALLPRRGVQGQQPSARSARSSSTAAGAPTTPSRETRRQRPSTRCTSSRNVAASRAASSRSGRASSAPASASAATASPFQARTTLSSRAGCGRSARAAARRSRTRSHRSRSGPGSRVSRPSTCRARTSPRR